MYDLQIDTKISTQEVIWGKALTGLCMVSRKYLSNKRTQQMIPVWNSILKHSDAKKNSVDGVSANLRYSNTSQLWPSNKDDSTISSRLSVTSDANASFTSPIVEDSVHSSTTLANQRTIIRRNISFGIESPNTPTYANNVNTSQVLIETEYKEDFHNQPITAELTQHGWEVVICTRTNEAKQHIQTISKGFLQIHNFDRKIEILLSETILPGIHLRYLSHGGGVS